MRKIKKINGFLVVKFNDREKREYEGTALGEYGVIDAEVYTGNLDIDRGAMEYDDADTLEVAVELARGLESEEDITDEPPTYTAAVETNESYMIGRRSASRASSARSSRSRRKTPPPSSSAMTARWRTCSRASSPATTMAGRMPTRSR